MEELKEVIRDVPDFPKEGIIFKDITTLLKDKAHYKKAMDILINKYKIADIDYVVGVESRGFIFASVLAYALGAGFIPVRKKGKLPAETLEETYDLEYGTDTVCIHKDAIEPGKKVLIVDDLLATGGTIAATAKLVEKTGGQIVEIAFLIELAFLKGANRLKAWNIFSIISY